MKPKNALMPVVAISILTAVGCHTEEHSQVQSLRWVEKADPITDAKKALSNGDHKLRAVYGLTVSIPGTDPKEFDSFKQTYGLHQIEGTTDGLINEEHGRLVRMAISYSETYNRHIINNYKP